MLQNGEERHRRKSRPNETQGSIWEIILKLTRRTFLEATGAFAAAATLGVRPENVLAADSGVLKIAVTTDIAVLDPGYMVGGTDTTVLFATMPSLARPVMGQDGIWSWTPSEYVDSIKQEDDLHIGFVLKKGLMWSDDAGELTADDVKFSFERMPQSDWGTRWSSLDHVEVTGKYSGAIVLKSPDVAIWMIGLASDSGFILPKSKVAAMPDQKFTTPLPAQLGPYRLTDWVPKQKIVLKADPKWTGSKPQFGEVQFLIVGDTKAGELALQANEVTATYLLPETAAGFAKKPLAGSELVTIPGSYYQWLGMNVEHPKLADIRVRKAIQRAIDVDSIIEASYAGTSPKATGPIPAGILGHRDKAGYSYDPEAAKALLGEAGVENLSLQLRYDVTDTTYASTAQIIQANLADIGIEVDLVPVDSGPYWELGVESKGSQWKDLQLTIMAFRAGPDPDDVLQWFTKDQIGSWNWERWSDPEYDRLRASALSEKDPQKRVDMCLRMQEIMENTGAYVWITYPAVLIGCRKGVKPSFFPGGDYRVEEFRSA